MNRRNFFRALSALAALPFVPRFLKAKAPDYPPAAATNIYAWDIDRCDQEYQYQWITEAESKGPWSDPQAYRLDGPEMMDWGGDVGRKPTYVNTFYCGDIREKWYYADGWGLIQSTGERYINGAWVGEWVVLGANTRDKKWETIEA